MSCTMSVPDISSPTLASLPFMIRMRAGWGSMERVAGNDYYIPCILFSFFILAQLLFNETSYFILFSTFFYLDQCIS